MGGEVRKKSPKKEMKNMTSQVVQKWYRLGFVPILNKGVLRGWGYLIMGLLIPIPSSPFFPPYLYLSLLTHFFTPIPSPQPEMTQGMGAKRHLTKKKCKEENLSFPPHGSQTFLYGGRECFKVLAGRIINP